MDNPGDIKLGGKWYRIDTQSYQVRDVTDFSPRAATPGGSVVHSELTLYQPMLQTDWRHGFGWNWYEDASGYMKTDGRIDARHDGIAMLYTNSTSSDTDNSKKEGFCVWNGKVYSWGDHGLRKYDGATWVQAQDTTGTDEGKVTLSASAVTWLNSAAATTNYGATTNVRLQCNSAGTLSRRPILKFDLSDIPPAATITAATLRIYLYNKGTSTGGDAKVQRLLVGWQEPSATWNIYSTGNNWTNPGGDFHIDTIGTYNFLGAETVGWKDITLTPAYITQLIDGTYVNYGFLINPAPANNASLPDYYFYSNEYATDPKLRPELILTYTTPALSDTGVVNFAFPAGDYLFYCPDGARIRKISAESNDVFTGNDNTAIDFKQLLAHEGFIYASKDNSTYLHRDSTKDLTDLEGTKDDTDVITVGIPGSFPIKYLITYAGELYAGKADGLWNITDSLIARRVVDFTNEASDDNFRSMAVHNGYLLFPIRDKIYQWNGARMSDVTPPRLSDTFPYTTYGRFDNFVSVGRFLYCTARTNETTYNEDLISFDGVAWSKLANLVSDGTSTVTAMNYEAYNNRMWYHIDSTADVSYYIQFQEESELPHANFPTTGTHELTFSRWDMGYRWVKKTSPTLIIEASNVTVDRYLTAYYALDGGNWIEWDKITSNGITRIAMPGGNQEVEYHYITIKIQFTTDSSSQSPILEGATLRFLMRPITVNGWSFNIPLAKGTRMNSSIDDRSTKQLVGDLQAARDNTGMIEFEDIEGNEYLVHITSLTRRMIEKNLYAGGDSPDLEFIAQINLVEAK